jgi:DNA-directed RNA polymerase subunit beta
MAYSFTEKKRIRNNFGKSTEVLEVPYLLATQIDSYASFLQLGQPLINGLTSGYMPHFPVCSRLSVIPVMRCWNMYAIV